MLENGRIAESGTYDELMRRQGSLHNYIDKYKQSHGDDKDEEYKPK